MKCVHCQDKAHFYCGKCLSIGYCSQDCATQDWRIGHSYQCIGIRVKHERDEPPVPRGCFNEDDPISLETIADLEPENVFSLAVGDKRYCFSLDSLVQWIQHNPTNPLTRQVLTVEELGEIVAANNRLLEHRRQIEEDRLRERELRLRRIFKNYNMERFGANARLVQIFIRWWDGNTKTVEINLNDTVSTLMRYLADAYLVPDANPNTIRLIYGLKQLDPNATLIDSGITSTSIIQAVGILGATTISKWDGRPSFWELE